MQMDGLSHSSRRPRARPPVTIRRRRARRRRRCRTRKLEAPRASVTPPLATAPVPDATPPPRPSPPPAARTWPPRPDRPPRHRPRPSPHHRRDHRGVDGRRGTAPTPSPRRRRVTAAPLPAAAATDEAARKLAADHAAIREAYAREQAAAAPPRHLQRPWSRASTTSGPTGGGVFAAGVIMGRWWAATATATTGSTSLVSA